MCGFIGRHPGGTQLSEDVWFYRPPPGGRVLISVNMCGFIGRHPGGRVLSSVNMCGFIGRHPGGTQLSEDVWFHRPPTGGVLSLVKMCGFIGRHPGGRVLSSVNMCGFIGRHPGGRVLSSVSMCGFIGRHPGGAPIHKLHGDVLPFRVCFFNRSHKQGFRLCLHGTSQEFHRSKVFFSDLPREHAQINPLQRDGAQKKSCRCREKMIPPTLKNILHGLTKKYLCFCKLPLLIKTKKQTKERIGNRSNHVTKVFRNYFVGDIPNQRQSLNIFPMP